MGSREDSKTGGHGSKAPRSGGRDGLVRVGVAHAGSAPSAWGGLDSDLFEALVVNLLARGDGWVRIVPAASGEVHWKFRFTTGLWVGRYVYWCQGKTDAAGSGAAGLVRRLDDVDGGRLIPSPDRY